MKYLILSLTLLFSAILSGQNHDYVIQLRSGYSAENFKAEIASFENNYVLDALNEELMIFRLRMDHKSFNISTIKEMRSIEHVEENRELEYRSIPNDQFYPSQYQMSLIGLEKVWDATTGGTTILGDEIVVAVIESGVEEEHPELEGVLWENQGEVPGDGIDNDGNGYIDDVYGPNIRDKNGDHPEHFHGMGVAGIIGARGNNDEGVTGVNWDIKIMLITEARTPGELIEAYGYIVEQRRLYNDTNGEEGAFVVVSNLSSGLNAEWAEDHPIWCQQYDLMGAEGILSATATTNSNFNVDEMGDMPTTCGSNYLIAVTASLQDDALAGNGYGLEYIDLAAPGTSIYTLDVDSSYNIGFQGTSSATPHVAGVIALLHSLPCEEFAQAYKDDPASVALTIKEALLDNTKQIPEYADKLKSGGRLSAHETFLRLGESCGFSVGGFTIVQGGQITDNGRFNLTYTTEDEGEHFLRIYNVIGQLMYEQELSTATFLQNNVEVDMSRWAIGHYFAGIYSEINQKVVRILKI